MKNSFLKLFKKLAFITFVYGILYYFFVYKLFGATGQWHWNLFAYIGKIKFFLITASYYAVTLYATRKMDVP